MPAAPRYAFPAAIGAVMAAALGLRVWGLEVGLPHVFNVDESAHFVPRAIGMFDHDYDPRYFINPPALTYVLHGLYWLRFGGEQSRELMATDPGLIYGHARVAVAVLAALAVGAIAWAGTRLFDRRVGFVAAVLLAVAFLPVHYGHFALNDAALLLPVCLALAGAAGILRGRVRPSPSGDGKGEATGEAALTREYVLAGVAVGVAAAFKYTAGIVLVAVVAAVLLAPRRVRGLALVAPAALLGFLALNPYALLNFEAFRAGLNEQSSAASDGGDKLGLGLIHPLRYYAQTLLWGLGVIPVVAAVVAALPLWARRYREAMVLLPAPLLFFAFMGMQDRFFARWALPIYPFLILLAAWGTVAALDRVRRLGGWGRTPVAALAAVLLGAQGFVLSLHNDVVMTRPDTRALAREWMLANIPEGSKIVLEPIAPDAWAEPWVKRAVSHFRIEPDGRKVHVPSPRLEDYVRSLRPDLIDAYVREGYCWVVTGSIIRGRPYVTPDRAPFAIKYYEALGQRADTVYSLSPLAAGADPLRFSFDDSYNWRPLDYERPGPAITIYRLRGGECAPNL